MTLENEEGQRMKRFLKMEYMKKVLLTALLMITVGTVGCGAKSDKDVTIIGGADGPTSIFLASKTGEEEITDDLAILAIKNYCYETNPDLKNMEGSDQYTLYWNVESSDENEIVVLFRSYTAAQVRYYIDKASGNTYVTEFVPGITNEERTDETFNVKDYYIANDSSDNTQAIPVTWQTASIGYEDGDEIQPEYYVEFTKTDVNYGHMKDGDFVVDHSDKISELEKTADGEYKVKAESANGVQYTYRTAEGDADVLEYYETWNEDDFSEMYRGGASLTITK